MKKFSFGIMLFSIACVLGSCKWGHYVPHSINLGGTQTTVVLEKANFRIVRNVETVIEINNSNLRRADVEKSAFAELTRKYPLTGSQAYINVVSEEIRRENTNIFRTIVGSRPNIKQFVAIRATIIEFLQENGEPIQSVESVYNADYGIKSDRTKQDTKEEIEQLGQEDIIQLAQKQVNRYYIMLLLRTNTFDKSKLNVALQYFDINKLQHSQELYSEGELRNRSANHHPVFEQFEMK